MKKLTVLLALLISSFSSKSQQFVKTDMGIGLGQYTQPEGTPDMPPSTNLILTPMLNVFTKKTHHQIGYSLSDKSIYTLNGYLLWRGWGPYGLYAYKTGNKMSYMSLGVEKNMPVYGRLESIIFGGIGIKFGGQDFFILGFTVKYKMFDLYTFKKKPISLIKYPAKIYYPWLYYGSDNFRSC